MALPARPGRAIGLCRKPRGARGRLRKCGAVPGSRARGPAGVAGRQVSR